MFMLKDEQIVTRLAPVTESGPLVVTSLRGGAQCRTKKDCEAAGGTWKYDHIFGAICIDATCPNLSDEGSGDWDY